MAQLKSFRELIAWQKAMDLADLVYELTEPFPTREHFGLAYQLRKSAVSIPSNIAEGTRRKTPGYLNHLVISLGSHAELDTQCEIATRRRYVKPGDRARLQSQVDEVGRIIHGLARSLGTPSDLC
jgi:four helix bundle protein